METFNNWYDCLVCNEKTRFFHSGVQICRPCSTFLRRANAESIEYTCKYDGKCKISTSRTACRACRLHCIQSAIKVSNTNLPSISTNSQLKRKSTQILNRIVDGYDQFLNTQRSIHVTLTPEIGLGNTKVIMAQKRLITFVEKQSLSPLICMFNEYYGPFQKLSPNQKMDIISNVLPEFGVFHRAYLTSHYFSDLEDSRVMFTNGYYMCLDLSLIEWFLDGVVVSEKIDDYLGVVGPLINKYQKSFVNFKKLGVRKIDSVALIFLSLWKRIELANLLDDKFNAYKDQLMTEWTVDLRKTYGSKQSTIQMAKLIQLYYECDNIASELKNVVTLLNVNSLEIDKDQLCEVTEYMKTLDIGDKETTLL